MPTLEHGTLIKIIKAQHGAYGCEGHVARVVFVNGQKLSKKELLFVELVEEDQESETKLWCVGDVNKVQYEVLGMM